MRVLLLAGEPSGDRLAAAAARALTALVPGVELRAMGGAALEEAGARLVVDSTRLGVVGITEVIAHLPELLSARRALHAEIQRHRPDVLVPVDYPDFNLRIARFAHERGVPVAWLVSPQVWAWRPGRIPGFARAVSRMLVLFPFEVETWRRAGVPVDHVGHPLADSEALDQATARARLGLAEGGGPVIAVLPGSRRREVRATWPVLAEAARRVARERPGARVVVPLAPGLAETDLPGGIDAGWIARPGAMREAVAAADVAAVASGTATLETAVAGRPLVVGYRVGRLTMALSRRAANPEFLARGQFALPNLVLGRDVVPELYQERFTPEAVARELARLLDDPAARAAMLDALAQLRPLLGRGAGERIARGIVATVSDASGAGAGRARD